jgi:predicted nucleotidyltransferase component of viral defense system
VKEYMKQIIEKIQDNNLARCIVREYLQARILEILQENGAFVSWVFVGGTALRFLYSMPRFSEDLDFSLVKKELEDNFPELMKKIKSTFESEDYKLTIKAKVEKTVKSAFLKFEGLLYEIGLSPHVTETISIKVEIDTNPPSGAGFETSVVRRHVLLNLLHYDKSSMLAGKLHALLSRKYVKGRDIYDLMWYLSDKSWPQPNIVFLNNALKQTLWSGKELTFDNWKKITESRISEYDWKSVVTDARPFVEKQKDLETLTKENLIKILETE